jgi:hypothetical protein
MPSTGTSSNPSSPNEPSAEDALALMRNIMELPAVKRMLELDVWGKEQGLDSDKRAAVVSAISALIASSENVEIAKEYIRRAADVIADLGPKALSGE